MRARADRRVAAIAAAVLSACSTPAENGGKQWSILRGDLDRVPLCVWGASANDVWIGGGGLASGAGILLLHGDGSNFDEQTVDAASTIWWIHGANANDVWAVGEHGLALHWDGTAWSPSATGTTATLFGVWAAAADDVWAVGGSPTTAGPNDVLLHYDGSAWTPVSPPRATGATYFKIWGLSASDVLVVANAGLALHYDGKSWSEVTTPSHATLFAVHGKAGRVRAIGGPPATFLRWDGQAFAPEDAPSQMSGAMTGVFVDDDVTYLSGERYQRYRVDRTGTFADDTDAPALFGDLHSVWGDGAGHAIAVGGNYVALTSPGVAPKGVVVRYGE